jgi:hypothetical protein
MARREVMVKLRCTADEKGAYVAAARAATQTLSAWARTVLAAAAARRPTRRSALARPA